MSETGRRAYATGKCRFTKASLMAMNRNDSEEHKQIAKMQQQLSLSWRLGVHRE